MIFIILIHIKKCKKKKSASVQASDCLWGSQTVILMRITIQVMFSSFLLIFVLHAVIVLRQYKVGL